MKWMSQMNIIYILLLDINKSHGHELEASGSFATPWHLQSIICIHSLLKNTKSDQWIRMNSIFKTYFNTSYAQDCVLTVPTSLHKAVAGRLREQFVTLKLILWKAEVSLSMEDDGWPV